jgi:uncharacterized protein (TIGR02099 family)
MKQLLQKLIKYLANIGAALVIVLAIAVGIFRLMLPQLPEYQEEIKGWASGAIGMQVEFSGMNARWRFSGPELSFFNAELVSPGATESLLSADEVSVGVSLFRLIADRELVVDRIMIRDTKIDLRQDETGTWLLQGVPVDDVFSSRDDTAQNGSAVALVGEDIEVEYEHPASGQLVTFTITSMTILRDANQVEFEASIDLAEEFGDSLEISANQVATNSEQDVWRLFVEGNSLDIAGWSRLQPPGLPEIDSGTADISLWIDYAPGDLQRATVNTVISGLHARSGPTTAAFGLQGSFEYSSELNGFLLAANQLRLTTVDGDWPQSTLQLRVMADENGAMLGLRANASFLDLKDLKYVNAWIPDVQRSMLADIDPSGVLRNLSIDLTDLDSEEPEFNVTADLESAGFAARDERLGLREFSGRIRADRDGGRIEFESNDLQVNTGGILAEPISFDDAAGTIIWRRNSNGIILLSDSIRIRNADFDSQSSLQISMPANGDAPFVDVESDWSINDVGAIRRYLPVSIKDAPLGEWLQMAPVAGVIRRGTLRLNGSLDKFPFDEGDGSFYVSAEFEDFILRYAEKWPVPEFDYVDVVVDKMRLSSNRSLADVVGNTIENAQVVIPDLRNPVIEIDAFATGTLESLRSFGAASPINEVLGGQLTNVEVGGDASIDLSISYPVKDKLNYDFSGRIRSSDGSVQVGGFAAPITELNGVVLVARNSISAESLFGRFLGNPVDIELARTDDPTSPYSVLLDASGSATVEALVDELGLPLADVANGRMEYHANIRFPNTLAETPGVMQINVESDMQGFAIEVPAPFAKAADENLSLTMSIEFPEPNRIESAGSLADNLLWSARFLKQRDGWDFDRGVLAIGGEYPVTPDGRGLHIVGQTPEVRVHDWLALARRSAPGTGIGDRVRTIDVTVDNLYVVGQHFTDHRVRVNRGGSDWVVELSGEQAEGMVTVPYDFVGERPLTVEMERLILPGNDEETAAAEISVDPRTLPEIRVRAKEFALGDRFFGQIEIDLLRTDNGLESDHLTIVDDSFTISGSAGWINDIYEESGQRTFLNAKLKSTDIQQTMLRLNYQPGIDGDDLEVDINVDWAGGPRQDFMGALNGSVQARLGDGQLEDLEPGAGRVFGLMSVVALPRRLSLDFRDVFDSGFSFDEITGNFRLVNGEAFTCDLTLNSPAADVGIVGRTGLEERDYTQTAIVSANAGNALPVAGLVVAGPQVAAALLIFSQIFKKPLQEMSQVYYAIDGSWDDPVIDVADAARFASNSSLAGCIAATE